MVSGYPTSTIIPQVDGLSTEPPVLGRYSIMNRFKVYTVDNSMMTRINHSYLVMYSNSNVLKIVFKLKYKN